MGTNFIKLLTRGRFLNSRIVDKSWPRRRLRLEKGLAKKGQKRLFLRRKCASFAAVILEKSGRNAAADALCRVRLII